jgi:hypothetical protein
MARMAMAIATNLPYSPDLALSGFSRFGDVKGLLGGDSSETGERTLSPVEGILIPQKGTLTKVLLEWMTKLEPCMKTHGYYIG